MDAAVAGRPVGHPLVCGQCVSRVGPEVTEKNDIDLAAVKTWCFPKEANGEYVFRMEDVLHEYAKPFDPLDPLICMDEASRQLIGQVAVPLPTRPGQPRLEDYEYVRKGTCNLFMFCQPLAGWRRVQVTERRTKRDWALAIRDLVDVDFPQARRIRLVMDNLNTHTGAALYETFSPSEARRLLEVLEFHYTPKHASWLNMAEIEIGILSRQCLNRRIDDRDTLIREVAAWEADRNRRHAKIHWTFTIEIARHRMIKLYPPIEV